MKQLDLLGGLGETLHLSTDIFDYQPALLTVNESNRILQKLIADAPWEQRKVMMYGREILTPRLTAWYGDGADYPAKDKPQALPWTSELLDIRSRVEPLAGTTFDSVLLNYYRDQNDSVAWHDDEDRTPGKNMIVASVSLGQERIFDIRKKSDHSQKISILLENGSYLLMKGTFQRDYEHRVAKSSKSMGARINLTFRKLLK